MGSGGSYIGQIIAKQLVLKYVDREVLHLAAQEFGYNLSIDTSLMPLDAIAELIIKLTEAHRRAGAEAA